MNVGQSMSSETDGISLTAGHSLTFVMRPVLRDIRAQQLAARTTASLLATPMLSPLEKSV